MENRLSHREAEIIDYGDREEDVPFGADPSKPDPVIEGPVLWAKGRQIPGNQWAGKPAVMKTVQIKKMSGVTLEAAKAACRKEASIMFAARHVHAMQIITGYFYTSEGIPRFIIVMGRANGKDLSAYLDPSEQDQPLRELQDRWVGCLIHVVAHIHRLGIRHRDIKPQNVLINDNEVLLTDFGISHMSLGKTIPTTNDKWNKSRTPTYCAPEVDEGSGRTRGRSADIFSLGAVVLEMLLSRSHHGAEYNKLKAMTNIGGSDRSYARSVVKVHGLVDTLIHRLKREEKTTAPTTRWHLQLLVLCRKMLDTNRECRPSADEVESSYDELVPGATQLKCEKCTDILANETTEDKLIAACRKGDTPAVDGLLNDQADPNVEGAIHQAALNGHLDIINRLLQDPRAKINTPDYAGQTALHYAAMNGHEEVVTTLLGNGAKVNAIDDQAQSPLHCAATKGSIPVMKQLLDKEAFIDATDNDRLTPLYYAARQNDFKAVKFLLEQKANKDIRDNHRTQDSDEGQTAEEYARVRGFKDVERLLRKWNRPRNFLGIKR